MESRLTTKLATDRVSVAFTYYINKATACSFKYLLKYFTYWLKHLTLYAHT